MSVSLYTLGGDMAKAEIDSITSEVAGYPKEHLIDRNPDTFWKPSATGTITWDIDLQTAKRVDAITFLVHNYLTDHSGGTVYLNVKSSPDDSTYTDRLTTFWIPTLTRQIYIEDIANAPTFQYWRIAISSLATTVELSGCFLCRKFTLAKSHIWPQQDSVRYHNRIIEAAGGREFVQGINSRAQKIMPREFILDSTDWTALKAAFQDSCGRRFPLGLYDGTSTDFVKFADDELGENQYDYLLYNPSALFNEVPYIPDGEVY